MKPKSVRDLLVSLGLTAGLGSAAVACNKVGNPVLFRDGAADTATDKDGAGGRSGANGTADGGSAAESGGQGGGGAGTGGGAGGMGTGGVAGGHATWNPPPPDGSWGFPDTGTVETRTDVGHLDSDGHSDADSTDARDAGG